MCLSRQYRWRDTSPARPAGMQRHVAIGRGCAVIVAILVVCGGRSLAVDLFGGHQGQEGCRRRIPVDVRFIRGGRSRCVGRAIEIGESGLTQGGRTTPVGLGGNEWVAIPINRVRSVCGRTTKSSVVLLEIYVLAVVWEQFRANGRSTHTTERRADHRAVEDVSSPSLRH